MHSRLHERRSIQRCIGLRQSFPLVQSFFFQSCIHPPILPVVLFVPIL